MIEPPTGPQRFGLHLLALLVLPAVALWFGQVRYNSGCGSDGDCDLAALAGIAWAFMAFCAVLVLVLVVEVALALRRRHNRKTI